MYNQSPIARANIGFSLMELLVTIFIVSILATIALPSYDNYVKRARLSKIISLLQRGAEELSIKYATTGAYPTTVFEGKVTAGVAGNAILDFGLPEIKRIIYINSGLANPTTKAVLQFRLDPTVMNITSATPVLDNATGGVATPGNNYNAIGIAMYPNTETGKIGSMVFACGIWNSGDIDLQYLPTECRTILSGTF